jgi:hypothetical protein
MFIFKFEFRACQAPNPGDTIHDYFPPSKKVS